ncbi:hypothetical protein BDN72DRAFT_203961 [Pluteus cervinus]|uniref:Uncharacterized protein n=1 Tax=Pluteus cervinus TaxID=181527 RepID=A0ACD3AHT4_9AGAR|nr:hypothetical protein BDN72DRAFT_203961 [Pluteus cervinus]
MHQDEVHRQPSIMYLGLTSAEVVLIDAQIILLQGRIRELKSQRNALAPISSLPEDVLAHVFQLTHDGPSVTCNTHNAFVVSWVCRLWHKVAVRSQKLWNYIDTPIPQLAQLCFEHVSSLQLELQLHLNPSSEKLLRIIIPELGRTSTLSLRGSTSNPRELYHVPGFTLYPAPTLKSLSLERFQLPEGIQMFTGIPPPLHSLSLSHCNFHWDAPVFGVGLTSLSITSPISPMSLGGFLDMLRHVPGLKTLRLENAFRSISTSLAPLQRTAVHLPALTSLALLSCSTRLCTAILLGLTFTNQANVVLNLHDNSEAGASFSL